MERAAKSVETRSQQEKAKQKALVLQTVIMKQKPDDGMWLASHVSQRLQLQFGVQCCVFLADARQAAIRFALECHEHRAPIFRELYAPSDQSETVISFEQQYRATKLAQLPHAQQHSLPTTIKFLGTEVEPFQNGK